MMESVLIVDTFAREKGSLLLSVVSSGFQVVAGGIVDIGRLSNAQRRRAYDEVAREAPRVNVRNRANRSASPGTLPVAREQDIPRDKWPERLGATQ